MDNGTSLIKDIGRSYIVSSLLPATLFVFIGFFIFRDFLPWPVLFPKNNNQLPILELLFWSVVSVWLAFALYSSVDWILKFFEGYLFPSFIKEPLVWLQEFWYDRRNQTAKEVWSMIEAEKRQGKKVEEINLGIRKKIASMRSKALSEMQQLEIRFPPDKDKLLPTALGNVLRASEMYSQERYRLEGITIWSRLAHIAPRQFMDDFEEKLNQLLFLLNSSLLSFLLAVLCIFTVIMRGICDSPISFFICRVDMVQAALFKQGFKNITRADFLFIAFMLSLFGYVIYIISIRTAEDYGLIVRAGIDLYRLDLLKHLNQPIPENSRDEKATWKALSEFFVAGSRLGFEDIHFDYKLKKELLRDEELADGPELRLWRRPKRTNYRSGSRVRRGRGGGSRFSD